MIQNGAHSVKIQENELCQTSSLTDRPAEEYNACFLGKKKKKANLFFKVVDSLIVICCFVPPTCVALYQVM